MNQKKYILHNIIDKKASGHRGHFFNTIKKYGGQTIFEETNNIISDIHLGESGHRVQFELFYEYINNQINKVRKSSQNISKLYIFAFLKQTQRSIL